MTAPKLGPPIWAVEIAIEEARKSPCAKSKRGAVAFSDDGSRAGRLLFGVGCNGPALGGCDGSEACKASCGKRCVHAEARAIRGAAGATCDVVHVKIDERGELAAGGGPSCWQCSRDILDAGISGVWLYERHGGNDGELFLVVDRWRYYTAAEFHRLTMAACGIHNPEVA